MIPRSGDLYSIDKIKKVFADSYDFPMKGYKLPRLSGDKNIANLRILASKWKKYLEMGLRVRNLCRNWDFRGRGKKMDFQAKC